MEPGRTFAEKLKLWCLVWCGAIAFLVSYCVFQDEYNKECGKTYFAAWWPVMIACMFIIPIPGLFGECSSKKMTYIANSLNVMFSVFVFAWFVAGAWWFSQDVYCVRLLFLSCLLFY